MSDIDSFFGGIVKPESQEAFSNKKVDDFVRDLSYICASEFGWSQEDFESCECAFLFEVLKAREKSLKAQKSKNKFKR